MFGENRELAWAGIALALALPSGCSAESPEAAQDSTWDVAAAPERSNDHAGVRNDSAVAEHSGFSFRNVAVLGASASAGFGVPRVGPTPIDLGDAFLACLALETSLQCQTHASSFFFLRPDFWGETLVGQAREQEPDLTLALDFLFWFGYGLAPHVEARRTRVRRGFELLRQLPGIVVVSELPDMSPAIGTMLVREQVPPSEHLAELNAEVRRMVAEEPRFLLAPLAEHVRRLFDGEPVRVGGVTWREGSAEILLQPDRLHPTSLGLATMALLVGETLMEPRPALARRDDFRWQPSEVELRMLALAGR